VLCCQERSTRSKLKDNVCIPFHLNKPGKPQRHNASDADSQLGRTSRNCRLFEHRLGDLQFGGSNGLLEAFCCSRDFVARFLDIGGN
jgi:hypothetical protein